MEGDEALGSRDGFAATRLFVDDDHYLAREGIK